MLSAANISLNLFNWAWESGAIPVIMAFVYTCSRVASNFALSKQAVVCLQVRFVAAPLPAKATVLREPFWNTEVKLVYGRASAAPLWRRSRTICT